MTSTSLCSARGKAKQGLIKNSKDTDLEAFKKSLKTHASIKILLKMYNIRNCLHYKVVYKDYFTQLFISIQYHLNYTKISWKH